MLDLAPEHESVGLVLADELARIESVFASQLASDLPAVNDLCRHVERYRGKMLRPTLVVTSGLATTGGACDGSTLTEAHRLLGATVEMIHMATLVHDDVLDEADVRRRGATVNRLRGNETAVMLGDYLISNAFHLCSRAGVPEFNLYLGSITNTLCEGELVQLHHREDIGLDLDTYFEIVRRKTAVLVGACCRLGARASGGDEAIANVLERFGEDLGVAFQIQDDLLDLGGEESVVGKSLGRDLATGKMTLPVILALSDSDPTDRGRLIDVIDARDVDGLRDALRRSRAIDRAREHAETLVTQAKERLDAIAPSPARGLLEAMADAVVARAY